MKINVSSLTAGHVDYLLGCAMLPLSQKRDLSPRVRDALCKIENQLKHAWTEKEYRLMRLREARAA
jgi:hypothetical protein